MARPDRVTFRLPASALFFPVLLFFCIAPLATAGGAWAVLFVVPVAALVWVIITRTTATPARVTAHGLRGSRRMAWPDLDTLEFRDAHWAIAVGADGRRLRLPMVRPRDLPRLVAVSGGTLNLGAGKAETTDPDDVSAIPAEAAAGESGEEFVSGGQTRPSPPAPGRSPVPAADLES